MQPLHSVKKLSQKFIITLFLLSISLNSMASEIKVYLKTTHLDQVVGIKEAESVGFKIHFVYLDRLEELEQEVSNRITGEYQDSIDVIINNTGLENLITMSDVERTEFFMRKFSDMNVKPLTPKSVKPSELSDIQHAILEIIEAEDQGITDEQLPAILFKGKIFPQTFDLVRVLKDD